MMQSYSLYIHIPFCRHRCAYCDFNTYAGIESQIPAYIDALCQEIKITGLSTGRLIPVHTVFFGGGTPSLLHTEQLKLVIDNIKVHFELEEDAEITIEANPGTLTQGYLQAIRKYGVNRLSLGMQSGNVMELRLLERQHDFFDIIQSVKWARRAGFDNINLDLIFGLPDQTLVSWQQSLERATSLQPEHLALYSLILESGTPMKSWVDRGLMDHPDHDISAEMYEWSEYYLDNLGYRQYEISNWARTSAERGFLGCRHNLQYWRLDPYLGFGAGAHGFVGGFHVANITSPLEYIRRLSDQTITQYDISFPRTPATDILDAVDRRTEMSEVMLMGLRLTEEGVSTREFSERFRELLWEVYPSQIKGLMRQGLLEIVRDGGERLRLTKRGRLLGNRVFIEFID